MEDLRLNSNFSVELDDRNDLATVSGREAFEQSVAIRLTELLYNNVLGMSKRETTKEKIRLQVSRVAQSHDLLNEIQFIQVYEEIGKADTYKVEVVYTESGAANFEEEVVLSN